LLSFIFCKHRCGEEIVKWETLCGRAVAFVLT